MLFSQIFLSKNVIYCLFSFFIYCGQVSANPIVEEYNENVKIYNLHIEKAEYNKAYNVAEKLLSIDPSDTFSLLRLTYSAQMLGTQNISAVKEHLNDVSRATPEEIEIVQFIEAIIRSKN
ncbi:MAG: hypothetical protein GY787_07460 [Alteromonadales bacterium]|nr:hypothetical protein [Alteromonadales bacterium]